MSSKDNSSLDNKTSKGANHYKLGVVFFISLAVLVGVSYGVVSVVSSYRLEQSQMANVSYANREVALVDTTTAGIVKGAVAGQTCSATIEYNDLKAYLGSDDSARDMLLRRYSRDVVPEPNNSFFLNNFKQVGDTARDPVFGYKTTLISTSINNINAERNHYNADQSLVMFRTGSRVWTIFDGNTGQRVSTYDLTYNGVNPTDAVRWHPTLSDILYYPVSNEIVYFNVKTGQKSVAYVSPFGALGLNNRRLAGGDGNDDMGGRILITHGDNHTKAQVLDLNTGEIVYTRLDDNAPNGYVIEKTAWNSGSPTFDLPASLDYATLSISGNFIVAAIEGEGTYLYDLSGRRIGQIYGSKGHMGQSYTKRLSGEKRESATFKLNPGQSSSRPGSQPGDMIAVDFAVTRDSSGYKLETNDLFVMNWIGDQGQSLSGPAGGGQHGGFSLDRFTKVLALNPTIGVKVSGHETYYNEIVELSINESDPNVRRITQHYITNISPVMDQPEAWLSPDGSKVFWKSDLLNALPGSGYLFMTELPIRTCPDARQVIADGGVPQEPVVVVPDPVTPSDPVNPVTPSDPVGGTSPVANEPVSVTTLFYRPQADNYFLAWVADGSSWTHFDVFVNGQRVQRTRRTEVYIKTDTRLVEACVMVRGYRSNQPIYDSKVTCTAGPVPPPVVVSPTPAPTPDPVPNPDPVVTDPISSTPNPVPQPEPPVISDAPVIVNFLSRGGDRYYLEWEPAPTNKSIRNYEGYINGERDFRQSSTNRSFRLRERGPVCAQIQTNYTDGTSSPFSAEFCLNN